MLVLVLVSGVRSPSVSYHLIGAHSGRALPGDGFLTTSTTTPDADAALRETRMLACTVNSTPSSRDPSSDPTRKHCTNVALPLLLCHRLRRIMAGHA